MASRQKICAGNWKLFKNPEETRAFVREFVPGLMGASGASTAAAAVPQVVIFPPAYNLSAFAEEVAKNSAVQFGPQNIHFAKDGAFTGEISASVVNSMGATWALIGHSERRTLFAENNELIAKKVKAALDAGLTPMLCVGETLKEREAGQTNAVVLGQLQGGLELIGEQLRAVSPVAQSRGEQSVGQSSAALQLVVAYEPVWAIGTGKVATPAQAEEAHHFIRQVLREKWGAIMAEKTQILYGGSVKPDNAQELAQQKNIDGFLVGGASLKPSDFLAIYKALV